MTTFEIKRRVDLSNNGKARDITVTEDQKTELREAGYTVAGTNIYGPNWKGERPIFFPVKPTLEDDYEDAILARQNYSGI